MLAEKPQAPCRGLPTLRAPAAWERRRKQAKLKNYHASRRFAIVAVDVVEISLTAVDGAKEVLAICDQFTRFVVVVPIKDETAVTVARALLQHWILLFGPPERLLSDNGPDICGEVIRHLCAATGIKKVFTTPRHPQTEGTVERFNRTLCADLAKVVLREDLSQHAPMAPFRYNSSYHSATGMTECLGMFGVDCFYFDAGIRLAFRLEDETQAKNLPARLTAVQANLWATGRLFRDRAARHYDAAVKETVYKVGDTVVVFNTPGLTEGGRKLHASPLGRTRRQRGCRRWVTSWKVRSEASGRERMLFGCDNSIS
jgi:transposase InsO family protein